MDSCADGWTDGQIHMQHRALLKKDYRLSSVSLLACSFRYQTPPPLSPGQSNAAEDISWELYSHPLPVLSADPSCPPPWLYLHQRL